MRRKEQHREGWEGETCWKEVDIFSSFIVEIVDAI